MLEGKSLSCIVYLYQTLLCFLPICLFSQQTDAVIYTVRQPLEGNTCFITCVFIYIIYRFFSISPDKTSRYCDQSMVSENDHLSQILNLAYVVITFGSAANKVDK
jgi:hypothetical protein